VIQFSVVWDFQAVAMSSHLHARQFTQIVKATALSQDRHQGTQLEPSVALPLPLCDGSLPWNDVTPTRRMESLKTEI
jgi:hypothetical protein